MFCVLCRCLCTNYCQLHACFLVFFSFLAAAPTEIYTLSLHDALPISTSISSGFDEEAIATGQRAATSRTTSRAPGMRSEEHTSELQSLRHLVCRLLLEKKKRRGGSGKGSCCRDRSRS